MAWPAPVAWAEVLDHRPGLHRRALARWADMQRDNDLTVSGQRVLRFPAFVVRDYPQVVAAQIRAALGL